MGMLLEHGRIRGLQIVIIIFVSLFHFLNFLQFKVMIFGGLGLLMTFMSFLSFCLCFLLCSWEALLIELQESIKVSVKLVLLWQKQQQQQQKQTAYLFYSNHKFLDCTVKFKSTDFAKVFLRYIRPITSKTLTCRYGVSRPFCRTFHALRDSLASPPSAPCNNASRGHRCSSTVT